MKQKLEEAGEFEHPEWWGTVREDETNGLFWLETRPSSFIFVALQLPFELRCRPASTGSPGSTISLSHLPWDSTLSPHHPAYISTLHASSPSLFYLIPRPTVRVPTKWLLGRPAHYAVRGRITISGTSNISLKLHGGRGELEERLKVLSRWQTMIIVVW